MVVAADESALWDIRLDVPDSGPCVEFHEPDLDGQLTALALIPDRAVRPLLRRLPLDGREGVTHDPQP